MGLLKSYCQTATAKSPAIKAFKLTWATFWPSNIHSLGKVSEHPPILIYLDAQADKILPAVVWFATRSSPVCRCQVKLTDDFGRWGHQVIVGQDWVSERGKEDSWLTSPPAMLLMRLKIEPVDLFSGPQGMGNQSHQTQFPKI